MGANDRVVRHLTLRADSEAVVRHACVSLQDAMRCATLPDAGERVLLIRRLDLGVIARGATPQALSSLLEQKVGAAHGQWVHGSTAAAASADFVFFRDAFEARCALALALVRGLRCVAWYWPLAVAEFRPAEGAPANLRYIALAIAALPEARVAVPAWVAYMDNGDAAWSVAAALRPADVATLLRAAARSPTVSASALPIASNPVPPAARVQPGKVPSAPTHREAHPPNPSTTADIAPPHPQKRVADAANPTLPGWWQALAGKGTLAADAPTAWDPRTPHPAHRSAMNRRTHAVLTSSSGSATDSSALTANASPPMAVGTPPLQLAATAYGGLLFVLPLLQRLGFAAWAETLPQDAPQTVVRHLLALMLRRLHAPPHDPAWLLTEEGDCEDTAAIEAQPPPVWSTLRVAVPRSAGTSDLAANTAPCTPPTWARLWLTACRRWLRLQAGIGVATLVCRPASMDLTATHADMHFRLRDADMRVRRAALDLDPGWVWWYGRVVHFNYGETDSPFADTSHSGPGNGS